MATPLGRGEQHPWRGDKLARRWCSDTENSFFPSAVVMVFNMRQIVSSLTRLGDFSFRNYA